MRRPLRRLLAEHPSGTRRIITAPVHRAKPATLIDASSDPSSGTTSGPANNVAIEPDDFFLSIYGLLNAIDVL